MSGISAGAVRESSVEEDTLDDPTVPGTPGPTTPSTRRLGGASQDHCCGRLLPPLSACTISNSSSLASGRDRSNTCRFGGLFCWAVAQGAGSGSSHEPVYVPTAGTCSTLACREWTGYELAQKMRGTCVIPFLCLHPLRDWGPVAQHAPTVWPIVANAGASPPSS
jgi:hypothetical protein